jgi:magnesium-transporting ATPase (P-type)
MRWSWQIGRLAGIELYIHWTFLLLVLWLTNKFVWLGILAEVSILLTLIYVSASAKAFHIAPLDSKHWLIVVPFSMILLVGEECRKWFLRRRVCHNHQSEKRIRVQYG